MKGFSLFTPLVGTAIVIMTIVVATTVVQNDVRISRSLSSSYSVSSQATLAKLIKAAAEIHVMENMEKALADFLDRTSGHTITCDGLSACDSATTQYFTGTRNDFITQLTITGLFSGVTAEVDTVTGYGNRNFDNALNDAIKAIVNSGAAAFTTSFTGSALTVTINSNVLNQYQSSFTVDFEDRSGNSVRLSIVPSPFSVSSTEPIKSIADATKTVFLALASTQNPEQGTNFKTALKTAGQTALKGNVRFIKSQALYDTVKKKFVLTTEWRLDSGRTFIINYRQTGFVSGTKGCNYDRTKTDPYDVSLTVKC